MGLKLDVFKLVWNRILLEWEVVNIKYKDWVRDGEDWIM